MINTNMVLSEIESIEHFYNPENDYRQDLPRVFWVDMKLANLIKTLELQIGDLQDQIREINNNKG